MKTTDQKKTGQRRVTKPVRFGGKFSSVNPAVNWTASTRKKHDQALLFKNRILYLPANDYLSKPEQLWLVESIVGTDLVQKAVLGSKMLTNAFFERLLGQVSTTFYLSNDKAWLLSYDDELTRADFGPLTPISLLEAVRRYGLPAVEKAKEKTAIYL